MGPAIVVLGSLNMDLVVRVERAPEAGETVLGADLATLPGGKGANQAVAAARLGADARLVGLVGADAWGRELVRSASAAGVDVRFVRELDGAASGVASIVVDARGENRIAVAPGANARLDERTVAGARDAFAGVRVFVAQLEVPPAAVLAGARLAREAGATAILNAAPATPHARALLAAFDVLVVNRGEAESLAGRAGTPEELARALADLGPRAVVVTLGAQGALALLEGRPERVPAFAVEVRDATAAGDAFVGALACALAGDLSWPDALVRASAAGALACTRAGAQPSLPDADQLRRFLGSRVR